MSRALMLAVAGMALTAEELHDAAVEHTRIRCKKEKSRTRQEMKDECDINKILDRFTKTGLLAHVARGEPVYADVSEVKDYKSIMDTVIRAKDYFAKLPARVRERFGNDPARYIDEVGMLTDKELLDLGLKLNKPTEKEEEPAAVVEAGSGTVPT